MGTTRRMRERDDTLTGPALPHPHMIRDDGDSAGEAVLVTQPLMDALGRMALLFQVGLIVFEDLVDDRNIWVKLGANRRAFPAISRRNCVFQHLRNRLAVDPEMARRRALAHCFDMAHTPNAAVHIHSVHLPALNSFVSGSRCGLFLRDSQNIRPIPLSILSPGFTPRTCPVPGLGHAGRRLCAIAHQVSQRRTKGFPRRTKTRRNSSPSRINTAKGKLSASCHGCSGAVPKNTLTAGT